MQFADPNSNWADWSDTVAFAAADDTTRLAGLREYIAAAGKSWVGHERITAEWVNKKLLGLGVTDLMQWEVAYTLTTEVTGSLDMVVYGTSRVEALEKAALRLNGTGSANVRNLTGVGTMTFASGPEDPDLTALDPDVPTTVDATLAALREVIMLGHVSGPKYCEDGANRVLAEFGLAPIPPTRTFTVSRPVEAVMTTTVQAFDENTAMRIAGWRWENNKTGYQMASGEATDAPSVAAN
jgi:hypothetical protein